jgi:hypothetical protein
MIRLESYKTNLLLDVVSLATSHFYCMCASWMLVDST